MNARVNQTGVQSVRWPVICCSWLVSTFTRPSSPRLLEQRPCCWSGLRSIFRLVFPVQLQLPNCESLVWSYRELGSPETSSMTMNKQKGGGGGNRTPRLPPHDLVAHGVILSAPGLARAWRRSQTCWLARSIPTGESGGG